MATGVPCIAGNAGGLREIISHGVTGLTVEPDNPRALADSVLYLLRNPKVAEEMALRAKAVSSENYSWKDIAGKPLRYMMRCWVPGHLGIGPRYQ